MVILGALPAQPGGEAGAVWVFRPHNAYPASLIRTIFGPVCLLFGCPRTVAYPDLMHKLPCLAFSKSDRVASGFAARRLYGRGTLSLRPAAELGWLWPGVRFVLGERLKYQRHEQL